MLYIIYSLYQVIYILIALLSNTFENKLVKKFFWNFREGDKCPPSPILSGRP